MIISLAPARLMKMPGILHQVFNFALQFGDPKIGNSNVLIGESNES
jgi:hypothetical protein